MPDPGWFGGVISLLVARFLAARSGDSTLDRFILDETVQRINRSLNVYLSVLGILAAMAPFPLIHRPTGKPVIALTG